MVPYVDAVVDVTVMRVLLFVCVACVTPYEYLLPTVYVFKADMANPDLFVTI